MANRKDQRENNRKKLLDYLSKHPCVDCKDPDVRALTFDHLRDKVTTVSELVNSGAPWSRVKQEIDKCVVRCASCHCKIEEQRLDTPRFRYWYENQRSDMISNMLEKESDRRKLPKRDTT